MAKYINEFVIVCGGTSGWLAAKTLSRRVPFTKVTLIDKEISEPVGVGEATLLSFKAFLKGFRTGEQKGRGINAVLLLTRMSKGC